MIKLLLVEDEPISLEGIRKKIRNFGLPDLSIVAASGGGEALADALSSPPDVLITDIRMPGMDGIELARRIRTAFPACQIIFLSSYSDKPYLKAAIALNAQSYIEKPVNDGELLEAVSRALRGVEESRARKYPEEFLEGVKGMFLQLWAQKLSAEGADIAEFRRQCAVYKLSELPDMYYRCLILGDSSAEARMNERGLLAFGYPKDGEYILYACSEDARALEDEALINCVSGRAFAGGAAHTCAEAHISYKAALGARDCAFYTGGRGLLVALPGARAELGPDIMHAFESALSTFNGATVSSALKRLKDHLSAHTGTPVADVKTLYLRMAERLLSFSAENQLRGGCDEAAVKRDVLMADSLEAIDQALERLVNALLSAHADVDNAVMMALAYIRHNFCDPALDLRAICDYASCSPAYLCPRFKQAAGATINRYINAMRMEKAQNLLLTTNDSLSTIAQKTGCGSDKYLCKLFKKALGVTPGEYRRQL